MGPEVDVEGSKKLTENTHIKQRSEIRDQRSESRKQKAEIRNQRDKKMWEEIRKQRSESRDQKSERQKDAGAVCGSRAPDLPANCAAYRARPAEYKR